MSTLIQAWVVDRLGWHAQVTAHAERLMAMWRLHAQGSPDADALWDGVCALKTEASEQAQALRDLGALLYAWDGSTALRGGAA